MFGLPFSQTAYLADYYGELDDKKDLLNSPHPLESVGQENSCLLEFYAKIVVPVVEGMNSKPKNMLEVGGGPTIYQLISLASIVQTILFTDFREANLRLVKQWRDGSDPYWRRFIKTALKWEGKLINGWKLIIKREEDIKRKLQFARFDVINNIWLDHHEYEAATFQVVCSNFCLESITDQRNLWLTALAHISSKVASPGILVITAVSGCSKYKVGEHEFPALSITDVDMRLALEDQRFERITIFSKPVVKPNSNYTGFLLVIAEKGVEGEQHHHR
jgi:hypothetical protein